MLLHFQNPVIIFKQNLYLYFTQFSPPFFTLTSSQNHPYNPHQHSLPLYFRNFSPPNNLHQKIFFLSQPFIQFRLRQGTKKIGSLVRNDTVLIFPFLLKVWTVITGLTITDFLSFRFTFYGISAFFKCNFCLAPRWKINWPRWFFFIFSRWNLWI